MQSSYIPWKGYFDLMQRVDEFILYDDAQFTRRDWRNRNRIKTKDGLLWLTIPVEAKGRFDQAIKDVRISDAGWAERHLKTIAAAYARAPHFRSYRDALDALYHSAASMRLSEVNRTLLQGVADLLGITTRLSWSMDYELPPGRVERLFALCQQAGATTYVSGPSARGYLDPAGFAAAGVGIAYMDYGGYPEYPQLFPPFTHQVSIIDVLLNAGPGARACLTSTAALTPA